jgi:hypothetical protein
LVDLPDFILVLTIFEQNYGNGKIEISLVFFRNLLYHISLSVDGEVLPLSVICQIPRRRKSAKITSTAVRIKVRRLSNSET